MVAVSVRISALAASIALLLAASAGVDSASASAPAWQKYVLGPHGDFVRPVSVRSFSGQVENPKALTVGRKGTTTLTMAEDGPPPVVVLDFGRTVSGIPTFKVASVRGSPTLHASFSESGRYIDSDGDNGGNGPCCGAAPPAAEAHRFNEWTPSGPGTLKTTWLQGSQRFMRIVLTTPGTMVLRTAGIRFKAFRAGPADYRGWFLSSDRTLNRIWYSGAYTVQLNMVPPGVQGGNERPQVVDGAKRDRSIWSGDLIVQNPVIWNTLGARGADYVKQSLITLSEGADPGGALPGIRTLKGTGFIYSETYSMHAANAMVDYFRYTGDREFARRMLPVVRKQLDFIQALTDERGLLVSQPGHGPGLCCGWDWNGPYDGPKAGAVTASNAIYFHTLKEAAWLERQVGSGSRARQDESTAASLRRHINEHLFDSSTGLYRLSDHQPAEIGQDSNVLPVLYGVAPADLARGILARVKGRLWTPYGTRPFSEGTGFSDVISPFVTGFETGARFSAGDDRDALALIRRLWGIMVKPGPDYSGGLWEKMSATGGVGVLTGSDPVDNQSLAHGWAAGPTAQLSESVLGATPVSPGYRKWRIEPHLGDLKWAKGRVPTHFGPIRVSWKQGRGSLLRGLLKAPKGTRGTVALPDFGQPYRVVVNGRSRGADRTLEAKGGQAIRLSVKPRRQRQCRPHWVTAWSLAPSSSVNREFSNQTIRTVSYTHYGGSQVRVVLSNRFGEAPVTFDEVRSGLAQGGAGSTSPSIVEGTGRKVTFGGKGSVTIQPGTEVTSDPVRLRIRRGESVVTSTYAASSTGLATVHPEARQSSYVASGNHAADRGDSEFSVIPNVALGSATFFLSRVEVRAKGDAATVATLGDSLTNGSGSSLDGNGRYPDALARLFAGDPRVSNLAIANAGIGGNRLLTDNPDLFPWGGVSAFHRLGHDVLAQPNLAAVLLIEGMNDIGSAIGDGRVVTSGDVILGLKKMAARVHRAGKKIFVGTIPPTGDPEDPSVLPHYSSELSIRTRREVSAFIRRSKDFDGYFEVEKALRDPQHPNRLAPWFDSGDGLHPNDAGYARMARTVKARMLSALGRCPGR